MMRFDPASFGVRVIRSFDEVYTVPRPGQHVTHDCDAGDFRVSLASYEETCNLGRVVKPWSSIEFLLSGHVVEHYGTADREIGPGTLLAYEPYVEHCTVEATGTFRVCQVRTTEKVEVSRINIPIVSSFMFRVYRELSRTDSATPLVIESLCAEMLEHCRPRRRDRGRRPRWLKTAKDLLHARFHSQVALSDVSRAVGIDRTHVARTFRQHEGMTIGEYVRLLRLRRAMDDIAKTPKSLAEISADAGFADQSHFGRCFRELFKIPPKAYRRETVGLR